MKIRLFLFNPLCFMVKSHKSRSQFYCVICLIIPQIKKYFKKRYIILKIYNQIKKKFFKSYLIFSTFLPAELEDMTQHKYGRLFDV